MPQINNNNNKNSKIMKNLNRVMKKFNKINKSKIIKNILITMRQTTKTKNGNFFIYFYL